MCILLLIHVACVNNIIAFLDQELISLSDRYSSCCFCSSCWDDRLQKRQRLYCFKSDRDEIWSDCSSSKWVSISNFNMAAMISFHAEKCWHVVSADGAFKGNNG